MEGISEWLKGLIERQNYGKVNGKVEIFKDNKHHAVLRYIQEKYFFMIQWKLKKNMVVFSQYYVGYHTGILVYLKNIIKLEKLKIKINKYN